MAERASISRMTLSKIENGKDPEHRWVLTRRFFLFSVLWITLADLADVKNDDLGLRLEEERFCRNASGVRPNVKGFDMEQAILVYVDVKGAPHLAGRLWARTRKN